MSDFEWVQLGKIAAITMGQSPDSETYTDDDRYIPFLQGCGDFTGSYPETDVFCTSPGKVAKEGSLLVSVRAPVGTTNVADKDYCIGRGLAAVKSNIVSALYLREAFTVSASFLHRRAQGSTFDAICAKDLSEMKIPMPKNRKVGEKITDIIQCINSELDATQALIDKYTAIKQGMMADLFSRGIDPETKALRPTFEEAPELYSETPLGMLPKGWVCAPIKKFVQSAEYGISTSLNDDSSGIPVLRMNNIQNNRFNVEDLKFTKDPEAYRLKLSAGDVLYNRTNSMEHVGKTAIWRGELSECSFASYLVRINVNECELLPEYFSFWMSQESSQNALRAFATPAVQQVNINPTNLQRVLMSCPVSLLEQREIVNRIDAADAVLLREREVLLKLLAQKSGLMQDLLTGKVPVPA